MNRNVLTILAAAVTALPLFAPGPAAADDVHCPPHLGNVTVDGNVLIAAPCELGGTTVKGNVHIYSGGSLTARGAAINGNIQAEAADFIDVLDTWVGGSIQLDDMVGDVSIVEASTIGGSIQLKSNRSRLEVLGNFVDADVQAFSNSGGVVIADNEIDGNLQCKSNHPAPAGGNNLVHGNKEDQCENLLPEAGGATVQRGNGTEAMRAATTVAAASASEASSGGGGSMGVSGLLLAVLLPLVRRRPRRALWRR